jgi:hypothetical protein
MSVRTIRQSIIFVVVALAIGFFAGSAFAERQPHMRAALHALKNARQQLDTAEADKGGHRASAIHLVDQAIHEVEAGIQFDNKH